MIHSAPFGFNEAFNFSSRASSAAFDHAEEDRVALLDDAPNRQKRDRLRQFIQERAVLDADRRRPPVRLGADLGEARRRVLDLVGPFGAAGPRSNEAVPPVKVTSQRATAGSDFRHVLERNRKPEIAAAELQDVGFEPRLSCRCLAVEPRRACASAPILVLGPWSWSFGPRSLVSGRQEERSAFRRREPFDRVAQRRPRNRRAVRTSSSARAARNQACRLRAASIRRPSGSDLPCRHAAVARSRTPRSSDRPWRTDGIRPTAAARRTHMFAMARPEAHVRGEPRMRQDQRPIRQPQIASVVAQLAEWFPASQRFQRGRVAA